MEKDKEKLVFEEKDIVYDNNKGLYRGVYKENNQKEKIDEIPLESRALVTEQQLNYLAKDVREYLDGQNYVGYFTQDPSPSEQIKAANNIFGDGYVDSFLSTLIKDKIAAAQGIANFTDSSISISDLVSGDKQVIYLTPEARMGDYGIPILSEYFKDVSNNEVIYRKSTYTNLLKDKTKEEWKNDYQNKLDAKKQVINNGVAQFDASKARFKNKYHFAEFTRLAPDGEAYTDQREALNGLYSTHTGGSVPAFCEYFPFDWSSFVPESLANIKVGTLLYQPSTGDIFEVTSDNKGITCNTLVSLWPEIDQKNNKITGYSSVSIYGQTIKHNLDNELDKNSLENEYSKKRFLQGYGSEEGQTLLSKYMDEINSLCLQSAITAENGNYSPKFSKPNTNEITIKLQDKDGKNKTSTAPFAKTDNQSIPNYFTVKGIQKTEVWLSKDSNFEPVINNNSNRIFYNTAKLNGKIFGEDIVANYPRGAMAIHCKKVGNINGKSIWKFIGKSIGGGGEEYPEGERNYERLLNSDLSNKSQELKVGDYIYNPNSTELRRICRDLTISECGGNTKTYLTEKVSTKIEGAEDGINRNMGTYLRGPGIKFLSAPIDDFSLPLAGVLNKMKNIDGVAINWTSKEAVLNQWITYLHSLNKKNVLSTEQMKTRLVFNALNLLSKPMYDIYFEDLETYKNNSSIVRFAELNSIIPGDQIIALTAGENNIYNNRIYQVTRMPYLFDIFASTNKDTFEYKKLFADYVAYCKQGNNDNHTIDIHKAFCQSVFITEIERDKSNDDRKFYYYNPSKDTENKIFIYNGNSKANFIESTTSIETWIKKTFALVGSYDTNIITTYAKANPEFYYKDIKYRILNNFQAPIAVNGIYLSDFTFDADSNGLVKGDKGDGITDIDPGAAKALIKNAFNLATQFTVDTAYVEQTTPSANYTVVSFVPDITKNELDINDEIYIYEIRQNSTRTVIESQQGWYKLKSKTGKKYNLVKLFNVPLVEEVAQMAIDEIQEAFQDNEKINANSVFAANVSSAQMLAGHLLVDTSIQNPVSYGSIPKAEQALVEGGIKDPYISDGDLNICYIYDKNYDDKNKEPEIIWSFDQPINTKSILKIVGIEGNTIPTQSSDSLPIKMVQPGQIFEYAGNYYIWNLDGHWANYNPGLTIQNGTDVFLQANENGLYIKGKVVVDEKSVVVDPMRGLPSIENCTVTTSKEKINNKDVGVFTFNLNSANLNNINNNNYKLVFIPNNNYNTKLQYIKLYPQGSYHPIYQEIIGSDNIQDFSNIGISIQANKQYIIGKKLKQGTTEYYYTLLNGLNHTIIDANSITTGTINSNLIDTNQIQTKILTAIGDTTNIIQAKKITAYKYNPNKNINEQDYKEYKSLEKVWDGNDNNPINLVIWIEKEPKNGQKILFETPSKNDPNWPNNADEIPIRIFKNLLAKTDSDGKNITEILSWKSDLTTDNTTYSIVDANQYRYDRAFAPFEGGWKSLRAEYYVKKDKSSYLNSSIFKLKPGRRYILEKQEYCFFKLMGDSESTIINGGNIQTGSITAKEIQVDEELMAKILSVGQINLKDTTDNSETKGAGIKVGKGSDTKNVTNGIMIYQNTTDKDNKATNKYNFFFLSDKGIRMSLNGTSTGGQGENINLYFTESEGLVIQKKEGYIFNVRPNGTININKNNNSENQKMIIDANGNVQCIINNSGEGKSGIVFRENDVRLISNGYINDSGNLTLNNTEKSHQFTVGSGGFEFKQGSGKTAHFTIDKLMTLAGP